MIKNKFQESDKDKVIDFLNFISNNAEFKLNTNECIKYFNMLAYMQKELLPKINDNILEIEKVTKKSSSKKE